MDSAVEQFKRVQAEGLEIFERKNKDYGNSFVEDGVLGVMIRMKDKLNRFISLARKEGERACKDESLRDTLLDLHNYAAMAIICHEEGKDWGPHKPTQAEIEEMFRAELYAGMEGGMDSIATPFPAPLHPAGAGEKTVLPRQPRTPIDGEPGRNHHEEQG